MISPTAVHAAVTGVSFVAVDPAAKSAACAYFDSHRRLEAVAFSTPSAAWDFTRRAVLVEYPVIRRRSPNPNDLLALVECVTEIELTARAGNGVRVVRVTPSQWKGQAKKPVNHLRVWRVLALDERRIVATQVKRTVEDIGEYIQRAARRFATTGEVRQYSRRDHNLLDAIGIGLWALRRI